MSFLLNPKIGYLKIDVSCEASINFHQMSQKATHATRFAPCHTWRSADNAIRKTRDTTRLKCLACHAKCLPKCCASHATCKSSSENDANVARLLHRTTCDALWNMIRCHEVPCLPYETTFETSKRDHFYSTRHRHGHSNLIAKGCGRLGTVVNGCGRLRMVADVKAASSEHVPTPRPPK